MKTSLTIYQRLKLAMILPEQGGSFREAIRVRQLRRDLMPDEAERKAIGFTSDEMGNIAWTKEGEPKEYEFSEGELDTIAVSFKALETEGRVPTDDQFLALYEIFADIVEAVDLDETNGG